MIAAAIVMAGACLQADQRATSAQTPLLSASRLSLPGKVLADPVGKRLFIADSNHHRIVVATLPAEDGRCSLIRVVGRGEAGREDGLADLARFNQPQGMARAGDVLYVADSGNDLIRRLDLKTWNVTTFAGVTSNASRSSEPVRRSATSAIRLPWDLATDGKSLYVAMAGSHQLWEFNLESAVGSLLAGSGDGGFADGPAPEARLARPSGVCLSGGAIFFADRDSNAVRSFDLARREVFTLVGHGPAEFEDADGTSQEARLWHCLGVTPFGHGVLVADTRNHKVKYVDRSGAQTRFGDGRPGAGRIGSKVGFREPGGLHLAAGALFVADTNNHRIVRIDLGRGRWSEIMISGLEFPRSVRREAPVRVVHTPPLTFKLGSPIDLVVQPVLPRGAALDESTPVFLRITGGDGTVLVQQTQERRELPIRLSIPYRPEGDAVPWTIDLGLAYRFGDGHDGRVNMSWHVFPRRAEHASTALHLTGKAEK